MLTFDIESNGLLEESTKVHCMAIFDGETMHSFSHTNIEVGVHMLQDALDNGETICGHNIIDFDIPCLEKLYPEIFHVSREQRKYVRDTLVMARLIYGNIKDCDYDLFKKGRLSGKLIGSQSLKAWGYRLGELKGTYAEETEDAWANFSEDMLMYNRQDVVVTQKLYDFLTRHPYSEKAIQLEHAAQWLMFEQEQNGFPFNTAAAEELEKVLRKRQCVLATELMKLAPRIPDKVFVPKRDNKRLGYKAGVPIQRYKDFNPKSRQQIEWLVTEHYHYSPDNPDLYEEDRLKVDEDTFHFMSTDPDAPEEVRTLSPIIEEYLMIVKRLGQLSDGAQAWLKLVKKDGCMHGRVNPCGAVSGRATHANPNVTQVPHNASPYGKECRSLFGVPEGWYQAGIDACGLELRCLAHFLAPYDGGEYADVVVNGDIHTLNQKAAGLATRDEAKRFIYAFLYGAGDKKMGGLIGGDEKAGKAVKARFLKKVPAIRSLRKAVKDALVETDFRGGILKWKRHWLKGLDGRKLHVRSIHSALNLLLQSAGALVCKYWIVRTEERLLARGLKHGWDGDFALMAWVHDEQQIACRDLDVAKIVVEEAQAAMRDTQAHYNFRVQLDTEGIIGKNWYDCH